MPQKNTGDSICAVVWFLGVLISTIKMSIPIVMLITISICMVFDALTLRCVAKEFDYFMAWKRYRDDIWQHTDPDAASIMLLGRLDQRC